MPQEKAVHFRPLGSSDAKLIHRMQKRLFPRELTEPLSEVRSILENTEKHMLCNLSYGLFDDTRMVGYVFAYVETESVFYSRAEEVIYLKEIGLLPGYESHLRPLFFKLYELWQAFTPNMPLEAHVMEESLEAWRRLVRLSRHFGVTLTDTAEVRKPGRPPYKLLRLDVAPTTVDLALQARPLPSGGWRGSNGVAVTVVTDARQWLSLRDDWEALLGETPDSNAFQSFDYLWLWWKYYGVWNELRVFVLRDGDTVIGVVPMMLEHFPVFGRSVRKLAFITTPMDMNRPKMIFGANAERCLPAFLEWLDAHAAQWDILDVDEQLQDETTAHLKRHFAGSGCLVAESATLCPYIRLEGSWERFMAALPRKMRSNVNRMRRRLAEQGEVRVRRVSAWPALDAAMETHCEIESRSWKAGKGLDLSSDKSHYFFHRGLAEAFGGNEAFELRLLECGGQPIASTYGIVRDGQFQSLKIAHDDAFERFSPGTVLESYELEDLFASNLDCYELMGSFLANKLRWTSTVHETVNVHVYRRRPRLALFFFIFFVFKRRVKSVLKRTGQFDRVDRLLKRMGKNPFPRY